MGFFLLYKHIIRFAVGMVYFLLFTLFPLAVLADFNAGADAYNNDDYAKAAEEFSKVAEKGDHRAMYALGLLYSAGVGVEQSYKLAYLWFRKAAKYGREDSIYRIGLMYEKGIGLKQDFSKALKWYGKSAKSGYALAQYKLGQFYYNGSGVKKNLTKSLAWFRAALTKIDSSDEQKEKQNDIESLLVDKPMSPESLENLMNDIEKSLSDSEKKEVEKLFNKYKGYSKAEKN